ncbi:serine/threonine-protein phosphatase 6 regulatory ankyrin repeat subunit B-like [Patella vulgata]|uniref:serine/threonine-protein phosphatase 6 regulatory ankyrin repeat subunit B-like n=1 Tax=Patella vulgata TaxID=6465 RepID=UPI0021801EDC|nr:serine/threonine-protein phosphatase 6 regulatory ankyrin repeat subunit B-like [Patella vulgata]
MMDSGCWCASFQAVRNDETATLEYLVSFPSLCVNSEQGESILMLACRKQNLETVSILLKHQKVKDMINKISHVEGLSALHLSIQLGQSETTCLPLIMALVEAGADLNICSREMMTPLLMSANRGFVSVLAYLIDHGADVHAVDQHECTVLHHIVTKPNACVILQKLIITGIQINLQNKFGETPLYLATESNNEFAVNMLLQTNDSCVDLADRKGITPLMLAAIENEIRIIQLLHKHGASVNEQEYRGRTSLYLAVKNGNNSSVEVLLKMEGCNVNLCDNKGKSPLMLASKYGNLELIELLHKHNVDVNKQDDLGRTSLYLAVQNDYLNAVDILLKINGCDGASVNKQDGRGRTSLNFAKRNGNNSTVDVLLKTDACDANLSDNQGKSPLMLAVQSGNTELMELLHQYGADINQQDNRGKTSLYLAVQNDDLNAVDVLLKMNDCDVNLSDSKGKSPLMLAVQNSNTELIGLLHQYGADINKQDGRGRSAVYYCLHQMCRRGEYSIEIMKLLECFGAEFRTQDCDNKLIKHVMKHSYAYFQHLVDSNMVDFDGLDKNGDNILHYLARRFTNFSLFFASMNCPVLSFLNVVLTDKRIDMNRINSTGNTPLMVAAILYNKSYMQALLQHGCITNISNIYGHTVLHLCIIGFVKSIYRDCYTEWDSGLLAAILSSDIDVNAQDKDGQTALMLAAKLGEYGLVKQLSRAGADCKILDKFGKSMVKYLDFDRITDVNFCKYIIHGFGVDITDKTGKKMIDVAMEFMHLGELSDALKLISYLMAANYCFQNLGRNRQNRMYFVSMLYLLSCQLNDHRKLLYESGADRIDIVSILHFMEDEYRYNDAQATRPVSKESEFHLFCNNICLKSLCRRIIRQRLGPNIQDKVTQLKLPLTVQNFLLLKYSLEDEYFNLETEDNEDDGDDYYDFDVENYTTNEFCIDLYDSEEYYDFHDCDTCTPLCNSSTTSSLSSSPSSPPSLCSSPAS